MELAELIQRQRDSEDERQVRISPHATRENFCAMWRKDIPEQILCASGQSASQLHKMRQDLVKLRTQLLGE